MFNLRFSPTFIILALLGVLFFAVPQAWSQSGGPYEIVTSTIDAGGGTMSGGPYSLTGTIGQPEPSGTSSGGPYTLNDGFWAARQGTLALIAADMLIFR